MTAPGLMVMAVDNLPAEMAREASQYFGTALYPFVEELVTWTISRALTSTWAWR